MIESTYIVDIGTRLIEAACRAGADQADVYLRYGPNCRLTWQHHGLSHSDGWESGLALRVWRSGRCMILTTNDFTPMGLEAVAQEVCQQAAQRGVPDHPTLPQAVVPLPIFPAAEAEAVSTDEKIAAIQAVLEQLGSQWPGATPILNASYTEESPWIGLVNSQGFRAAYQARSYALWVWLEGASGHLTAATASQRFADLDLAAFAAHVQQQTRLDGQPVITPPTGRYAVLLSPAATATLARTLGSLFTGENLLQALRPLRKRINKPIAASALTLIDDSTLVGGAKSRPLDDEGTVTEATTLIEQGVLRTVLQTRQTADSLGLPPNGKATRANLWQMPRSAASNIYIQAGKADPAAMRAALDCGLVVTAVLEPGRIQGVSGNFVIEVQGEWVENKQCVGQVDAVRLSLNIFELLRRIRGCGHDLQFSPLTPGAGGPTLLIDGMQVG